MAWVTIATCVAALIGSHLQPFFAIADSTYYLRLAAGRTAGVMQPFAQRQLGPLLAALLARLLHVSVEHGFLVEAAVSLVVMLAAVCWLAMRTAAPRWMLAALVLVPTWVTLVQNLVFPDLLYAALLAVVFVLMERGVLLAAALMMFPLMLTRESTSLTLVCFLVAAWGSLRWRERVAAAVAAVAGSVVVHRLAAGAPPNPEHLPEALYMAAKVPWNLLRNVLGVLPWSDANRDLCAVPLWSFPFHVGPVHALGVCGFSIWQQMLSVQVVLTNFGLLPLLLVVLGWRRWRGTGRLLYGGPVLRFALLYGAACFVLAPVIGAGFLHLVGYSWPLFLVALPEMFDEMFGRLRAPVLDGKQAVAAVGFFGVHLAVCAVSYWPVFYPQIGVELGLWMAGYVLLRQWLGAGTPRPPENGLRAVE